MNYDISHNVRICYFQEPLHELVTESSLHRIEHSYIISPRLYSKIVSLYNKMNIVHLIMIEIIYMYNVRQLGQKYNFPQSIVFCSHIDKIAFDGHKITTKYFHLKLIVN